DVYITDYSNSRVVKMDQSLQTLSFANTNVGQTSSDSPQNVTVQNIGNQPLTFMALVTIGDYNGNSFNLDGPETSCSGNTSLTAGESCILGVEFDPTVAGIELNGTVSITDNNLNASVAFQQVSLSGVGLGTAATIALSENQASSVSYGTPVTVTATLSGSSGAPTGNITYTVDGGSPQTAALSSVSGNGVASFTLPGTLAVGTHSVLVNYAGDTNYTIASTEQGFTLTVTAATTTTTLTALPNTITAGGSVALTATVSAGTTPVTSGTVTFSSGSTSIGAAQLNAQGEAILTTTTLPVGTDSITASFVGTENDAASSSTPVTVTVNAATPVTAASYTLTANPTSLTIVQGQTGTAKLTLTPVGGYTGTLMLSCGNLPSYVTCTFAQGGATNNTVTLGSNGQPVAVTLSIQTNVATARLNAMPALPPASPHAPFSPLLPAMVFGWPVGLAGGFAAFRRRRKGAKTAARWMQLGLLALLAGALAVGFSGCGGGGVATPTGASTILVTATPAANSGQSSEVSQSLPLTLTITQ
ncbi:MAG: Ig-like domain repeat protein, partial [Acidobacteriaceae bacterium]